MPVYTLSCPECGHEFKSMVMAGAKVPEKWVCSVCTSDGARQKEDTKAEPHPWDFEHGNGSCPCCF